MATQTRTPSSNNLRRLRRARKEFKTAIFSAKEEWTTAFAKSVKKGQKNGGTMKYWEAVKKIKSGWNEREWGRAAGRYPGGAGGRARTGAVIRSQRNVLSWDLLTFACTIVLVVSSRRPFYRTPLKAPSFSALSPRLLPPPSLPHLTRTCSPTHLPPRRARAATTLRKEPPGRRTGPSNLSRIRARLRLRRLDRLRPREGSRGGR